MRKNKNFCEVNGKKTMNNVASNLQKSIQDNFSRLNLLGMNQNTAQVLCSCNILGGNGLPVGSATTTTTIDGSSRKPVTTVSIVPDFVPGRTATTNLSAADIGNTPFIFPDGVSETSILQEQAAALAPIVKAAEEEAKISVSVAGVPAVITKEASGDVTVLPAVITKEASGDVTVLPAMTTPTTTVSTATPAVSTTTTTTTIEQFAPIRNNIESYREIRSPHFRDFHCQRGSRSLDDDGRGTTIYPLVTRYRWQSDPIDQDSPCAGFGSVFLSSMFYLLCLLLVLYIVVSRCSLTL
jgi:hypothetical protein